MDDKEHVKILLSGRAEWKKWRQTQPDLRPDFAGAVLTGRAPDLSGLDLERADFRSAWLEGVSFKGAYLGDAVFASAKCAGADFSGADLNSVDFTEANLSKAVLRGANLYGARLVSTDLRGADLSGCRVFGVAAWDVKLEDAVQKDLTVTDSDEERVTADDLRVAQFIHLMLRNENIRHVIDTVTSKAVLLLGRFTEEHKEVLDAVKEALRVENALPILFDFKKSDNRTLTETVRTLASMSRYIIVDLTDPSCVPHELATVVPGLPSVPVMPLIESSKTEYAMFADLRLYPWVMEPYRYASKDELLASLREKVVEPAEQAAGRVRQRG
ncbi:MAG: pentapeptide repeat-containing protein [Acidobacteriota bacterium]|nr:pentapeptide repeat-containing protein [Acidobacteriota bacterium]